MVLIFIHIVAHIKSAFSFIVIFHGINDYSLVIHSPVYGHQHCYHFLIIMNDALINFCVQVFSSLEYISLGVELISDMLTLCLNF